MSQDAGAEVTSSVFDDSASPTGSQLVELIRNGQSFSGRERNCVFLNTRKHRFANASAVSGLDFPDDARAIGFFDWDWDGDLDLWIANRTAPQLRLLTNTLPKDRHFLAMQLQGTECNRDAIGAKVSVWTQGETKPQTRTVKAGSGYLSQSTKWLHFGLGTQAAIERVTVRWPGGEEEEFADLSSDTYYRLVQGQGKPQTVAVPRHVPKPDGLAETKTDADSTGEPSTDQSAVFSATRLPLPQLSYENQQGQVVPLQVEQPTLLVLWASWCQPCLDELSLLVKHQEDLKARGLRVVLLSVDKLDPSGAIPDQVNARLEQLEVPFESGFATEGTAAKLQLAVDYLFLLQKPLPIPTSFLIDKDFALAGIYRGPLEIDRVFGDSDKLTWQAEQRRDASVPFSGRWIGKPKTLRLAPFVVQLAREGFVIEASEYVQRVQNQFDPATIIDLISRLGVEYVSRDMLQHAQLHFQMARKISPNTVVPELLLAKHWEQKKDFQRCLQVLEVGAARNRHPPLINALAWQLATSPDRSVRNAQRAVELAQNLAKVNATDPDVLHTLMAALLARDDVEEAIRVGNEAALTAEKTGRHRLSSEIRKRLRSYEDKDR